MNSGKNILIIEDDRAIREMMASVLELGGYSVRAAENGKHGIEMLKVSAPDVILLDMMMPVMSGWDFLDFMHAQAPAKQVPVVVVSAYPETALSTRPAAVVAKPIKLKKLLDAIESCAA